jgi:hypothetical protein
MKCDCIENVRTAVEEQFPGETVGIQLNLSGREHRFMIATYRRDFSRKRVQCNLQANFCPFCGRQYDADMSKEGVKDEC